MKLRSLIPTLQPSRAFTRAADPFTALQQDMNRLFDNAFTGSFGVPSAFGQQPGGQWPMLPAMEVKETDKALELTAELPGVAEKDIDVALANGMLTIRAEKHQDKDETSGKDGAYHVTERSYGAFARSMQVPFDVDADKVTATFKDGVLKLVLPKPLEVEQKTQKIAIKGGT